MTQSKDTSLPPDSLESIADNKSVRNSVFLGSAVVAIGTAVTSIRKEFYHEIIQHQPFKALRDTRIKEVSDIGVKIDRGLIDRVIGTEIRHEAGRTYTTLMKEALGRQGISNSLFKGTWQRARELGFHNLTDIAMKTGASLALTLGGYYLINQNVRLKSNNKHQDDKLSELRQRIDEQADRRIEAYERASR